MDSKATVTSRGSLGDRERNEIINDVKRISRRTVAKGIAWSAPVVVAATATPALAASVCTDTTNFDALQLGSKPGSVDFYDMFGQKSATATLNWQAYNSSGSSHGNTPGNTGKVYQTSGSGGWKYIEMQLTSRLRKGDYVKLTLTFDKPLTDFSLLIHDIDKSRSSANNISWVDEVYVESPSGFTYSRGSAITGTGTSADPFTSNVWGDLPIESGQGTVRITWPGEVSSVTIVYRAGENGNASSQHVGLGDMQFNSCVFPPEGPSGRFAKMAAPQQRSLVVPSKGEPKLLAAPEEGDVIEDR